MSKNKKGKKGKSKPTNRTRRVFTNEQKFYACKLKKDGLSARAIVAAFRERYGFRPTSSTLSTFYKRKNLER